MAVFWVVAPFSLVVDRGFRGACCVHHQGSIYHPDDGGSKRIWNVGKLLPDYMVQQPRRQPSEYLPPWEPEILLFHYSYVFTSRHCDQYILNILLEMTCHKHVYMYIRNTHRLHSVNLQTPFFSLWAVCLTLSLLVKSVACWQLFI
jgi:hypothetical protein